MMTEEYFSSLFKTALSRNSQQPQKIKDEEKKKEYPEEEPEEEYNDTDSAGDLDGEEILGSDDDEQENPKDYKKVLLPLRVHFQRANLGRLSPRQSWRSLQQPLPCDSKAWLGPLLHRLALLGSYRTKVCRAQRYSDPL